MSPPLFAKFKEGEFSLLYLAVLEVASNIILVREKKLHNFLFIMWTEL